MAAGMPSMREAVFLGFSLVQILGFLAVTFATINVVGGFLVTHRMLEMFQKKDRP